MGVLKELIKKQYTLHGSQLPQFAAEQVYKELKDPGKGMLPGDDLRIGGFAYLLYDLAGKSSPMEQYSPVFVCDIKHVLTKKYVWGVSLNFIPLNIRIVFFDQILKNYTKMLEHNAKVGSIANEKIITGVSFENVYGALQAIGYEYALRQFDLSLVSKFYNVSTNFLDMFMTMDTRRFTGVDEGKLLQIWMAKLDARDERHQMMMMKLYNDYDQMADTLTKELKNVSSLQANLTKTAKVLRKIQGDI